jgi:hypothetical protein
MISNNQLDIFLEKFAKTINNHRIGLVYHNTAPEAIATNCFDNVFKFIRIHGGNIKFGWTFNHRVNAEYGDYLFATHHAVWHAPNGNLIDITPFHGEVKHHPITANSNVLFLLDDMAQPIKLDGVLIPLPLKYFPILDDEKLKAYIETLNEKEAAYYKTHFRININEA